MGTLARLPLPFQCFCLSQSIALFRYLLIVAALICLLPPSYLHAQNFLVGLKGGLNATQVQKNASNSHIAYISNVFGEDPGRMEYYEPLDFGTDWQVGLSMLFEYGRFGLAFEPAWARYSFAGQAIHNWRSDDGLTQSLGLLYRNTYRNQYVELPLTFRMKLLPGRVSPHLFAGGYLNILANSTTQLETFELDQAVGSNAIWQLRDEQFGSDAQFEQFFYGLTGGVGVSVELAYVRIALDVAYRHSLSGATQLNDPYSDPRTTDLAFQPIDDLNLHHFQATLGCFFPVNFTMGGGDQKRTRYVVPYDLRRFNNDKKRK